MKQIVSRPSDRFFRQLPAQRRLWTALAVTASLISCGGDSDPSSGSLATSLEVAQETLGTLAVGLRDESYSTQLQPPTGGASVKYLIVEGELPPGLTLDSSTGEISGRPALVGEFAFTVQFQNSARQDSRKKFSIFIDASSGDETAAALAPQNVGSKRIQALALQNSAGTAPDVSGLLNVVAGMAEGEWRRANLNAFSSVWAPAELRPLIASGNPTPSKIILAWSGFAWDSNRASLLLYGGGHANYTGNDVYAWRASTQMWERASLPSQVVQNALGHFHAIDGVDKAPASAHTYDNNIFLPILDKMLVFGGAAYANGGHFLTQGADGLKRNTGPYLFDPSRAHPDKVGGSTGSHVQRVAPFPQILGGNMWSNRESWLNASASSTPPTEALTNGCTGYSSEQGRDIVYIRTASRLFRYDIQDINTPASDRWTQVGRYFYGGSGSQSTCGYDPTRKLFLSTHASQFIYWDLSNPSVVVRDTLVTPTDPTGEFPQLLSSGAISLRNCGMEFDPGRSNFKLWCGDGRVWTLTPPATLGANGWSIVKAALPAATTVPSEGVGTGILGKWKYVPNLDVFLGLADAVQGNIWIYKPHGWVNPVGGGNLPPSVSITAPQQDASFTVGSTIAVSANAMDGDGSIAKVEFFANGSKIGESLAPPFGTAWSSATAGTYSLTALATDNAGATKTSSAVVVSLNPVVVPNAPPTVALVRPAPGSSLTIGTPVTLEATATDSDGAVVRVEFFSGSSKIGESTASPYTWVWTAPPVGNSMITAVATDDRGATSTSASVPLVVVPSAGGVTTVTLQRGTGSSAVADTYLSSYHKTLSFGTSTQVLDQSKYYSPLIRFAIFQSEGGPVPDGAQITSATLSLYKYSAYDMVFSMHRVLRDWGEGSSTWNLRLPGTAWSTPGANGLGTDVAVSPDASASTGFDLGWINFDVTTSVQEMGASGSAPNYGWKLFGVSGYLNAVKRFYTSEFTGTVALRPKLTIVYE